jgi:hypothetical protein
MGRNRAGTQCYRYLACRCKFTPAPKEQGHGTAVHLQAVRLYLEGMSLHAIGRLLGVVHQSIANWVAAHAATVPSDPTDRPLPDAEGNGTVEVDELMTFIGEKATPIGVMVAVARATRLIVGQQLMRAVDLDTMQLFADTLPAAGRYCTDGAAVYGEAGAPAGHHGQRMRGMPCGGGAALRLA